MMMLSVVSLFFLTEELLYAQNWYEDTGGSFVGLVQGSIQAVSRLCRVILIIAGAGSLFFAIMSMVNGDQEGAKRFFIWLAGLAIGFGILSVLGRVGPGGGDGALDAGPFSGFKGTVKSLMQILLLIVSMTSVVRKAIQLIHGEKEGGRELFKWFAVSLVGFTFLSLI